MIAEGFLQVQEVLVMDGAIACVDAGKSVKLQQLTGFDRVMLVAVGSGKNESRA